MNEISTEFKAEDRVLIINGPNKGRTAVINEIVNDDGVIKYGFTIEGESMPNLELYEGHMFKALLGTEKRYAKVSPRKDYRELIITEPTYDRLNS